MMSSTKKMIIVAIVVVAFLILPTILAFGKKNKVIFNLTDILPKHPTKRYKKRTLDQIDQVVVHHSTGPTSQTAIQIANYHVGANHICSDGCPGIAYHYIINRAGFIYQVNPLENISYHVGGQNTRSIGVCFIGDYEEIEPTETQIESFEILVKKIENQLNREMSIAKHSDFRTTSCPGYYLSEKIENLDL